MTDLLAKLRGNSKLKTKSINIPLKYQGLSSIRFASNGNKLLLGTGAGYLQIWRSEMEELHSTEKDTSSQTLPITSIKTHPKFANVHYFCSTSGHVHTCDITTGACNEIVCEDNEIYSMDFQPDGNCFVTAGKDQCIRVYDTHTNVLKLRYKGLVKGQSDTNFQGHSARIFSVKFSPNNPEVFITGGWDKCLKVWDVRTNFGPLLNIYGPHLCGDAIDAKVNHILTGSWVAENALQLWDIRMAKLIQNIRFEVPRGSGEFLYCAKFCGDDLVLAGGSGTDSAQVIEWDHDTKLAEVFMSKPVHVIDVHNTTIAIGGSDNYFKIITVK